MADPTVALTRQLLEWLDASPRPYSQVVETWRTTCPRLSIWEDACIDGLIDRDPSGNVIVSEKGRRLAA